MRAFGRNVLGELGQEIQGIEDLEIPVRPGHQTVALRFGEGSARVLLGLVDNLPGIGYLDQPRMSSVGGSVSSIA